MIVLGLAMRDLIRDRFFFICNVAVIVGVLAPLLVLFGVKNGVYQALIGEMMANPATLQIDTLGNNTFTDSQIETLRSWPDVIFVTPKVRSQFDYVNVYVPKARERREAILIPSGTGDHSPWLAQHPTGKSQAIGLQHKFLDIAVNVEQAKRIGSLQPNRRHLPTR